MKRYGMIIGLKAGKLDEYRAYHKDIWQEILEVIKQCNIKNYTIFHKNDQLFSYFEYHGEDFKKDMRKMAEDKKTQEWWAIMGPLQDPLVERGKDEWWANMEEVFHTN